MQLLSQIDHTIESCLQDEAHRVPEVSITIPYNGATLAFLISVLNCFGLSKLKFCKSYAGIHLVKVSVNGIMMTEEELREIVNRIEMTFFYS